MAFDKNGSNSTAIGTFETPSGSHTIDCHGLQKVIFKRSNQIKNNFLTYLYFK